MSEHCDSMENIEAGIIEEFDFLEDWLDRYQQIIDLGRGLAPLADNEMVDANKVEGCQSQVWLITECRDGRLYIRAISDAAIVSGLIALVLRVFSGQKAEDILSYNPRFIRALGLDAHLSPTRKTGLAALITRILEEADACRRQEK